MTNRFKRLCAVLVIFGLGVMATAAGRGRAVAATAADSSPRPESPRPRTLIGLQYESFFTPHNVNWNPPVGPSGSIGLYNGTPEAIPILGKYSSFDVNVIKKHEAWFEYVGIDDIVLDWTNFLIAKVPWEEHRDATGEAEKTTKLIFDTYHQLELEGKHPPKIVFMMPLFKSAATIPIGIARMNKVVEWTDKTFLENPVYRHELLDVDGKPLMLLPWWGARVDLPTRTCADLAKFTDQIPAPRWTVRWLGTQLDSSHVDQCGYWSWMDGTIRQVVVYRDGQPEVTNVADAVFPFAFTDEGLKSRSGWLDPKAVGKDHGAPYLESWKVAFESHPRFIQIHEWNEFAGQPDGVGMGSGFRRQVFGDQYSLNLSDDMEPTRLNGCGYRECGGWGYYYLNLTKALISLYRGETPDITVLALSSPGLGFSGSTPASSGAVGGSPVGSHLAVVKTSHLPLAWTYLGPVPSSYTIKLDGKVVADRVEGDHYALDLSKTSAGKHTIQLVANGVQTYFDLDPRKLTVRSTIPLPVTSEIEIAYAPPAN